jgi:hypothetical protein
MLSKSWFFRLSTLAFLILVTPILGVYLHAPSSTLIILAASIIVGFFERSISPVIQNITTGIANNKLLLLFTLWYCFGAIINTFFGGNGIEDWRLMINPFLLIVGLFFTFAFLSEAACERYIQIGFIIALGLQSIVSINQLLQNPGIARAMWHELSGTWIYGNPTYFSTCIILLPVLFWRSISEKKLKPILLVFNALILFSAFISSFGTPVGLIIISLCVILSFALTFIKSRIRWGIFIIIISLFIFGFRYASSSSLLSDAYSRIVNFINDPTSGGYSGATLSASRWYLDQISIASFEKYPLFGAGGGSTRTSPFVGGHSSVLDTLGAYGILGGGSALSLLIFTLLFKAYNHFFQKRTWKDLMIVTSVTSLFLAGVVNPYWEGLQPLYVIMVACLFNRQTKAAISATQPLFWVSFKAEHPQ